MGRNDSCFCLSGKKKKKCHPDIHEESQAAAKLRIYGQLERDLKKHNVETEEITLCVEGCSDCCFDYFTVQSIEFDLILNELCKWEREKLDKLINKVEEYWVKLVSDHPAVGRLSQKLNDTEIDEIHSSIDKTSFPCVFLDDNSDLCQIYSIRPFKCRVFGRTYYAQNDGSVMPIACDKYGKILNEDNFGVFFHDVTEVLDSNTDLSIIEDKKRNLAFLAPEYPLIYNLYKHFVVDKLGTVVEDFDDKFKLAKSSYHSNIIDNMIRGK